MVVDVVPRLTVATWVENMSTSVAVTGYGSNSVSISVETVVVAAAKSTSRDVWVTVA